VTDKTSAISPYVVLNKSFNCQHLMDCLESAITLSTTNRDDHSSSQGGDGDEHSNDEGTDLGSSPQRELHSSTGTHASLSSNGEHRHHRGGSGITVSMDELATTSDRWERNEQGRLVGRTGDKTKKKKTSKNTSSALPPIVPSLLLAEGLSTVLETKVAELTLVEGIAQQEADSEKST
jgi:hypothetical protein